MTAGQVQGTRLGGAVGLSTVLLLATVLSAASARPPETLPRPEPAVRGFETPTGMAGGSSSGSGTVHGRVAVSALTIEVTLSQRAARAGQPVQVRATLVNRSSATVTNLVVHLSAAPAAVSFRPAASRLVRRLTPGTTEVKTWIACAPAPGTYAISAHVEFAGTRVAGVPAQLIVAEAGTC